MMVHRSLLALVLSNNLLLLSTAVTAAPERRPVPSEIPAPRGLAVVIVDVPKSPLDLRALDNESISGAALQIHWSDIEPVEGKPDWSKLDALFGAAEKSKKWVQLLIFPGFFTPEWALKGVSTETFPLQYGPGNGSLEKLPAPWDMVYLNRWFGFLSLLSERYGKSPAFRVVAAVGPTSVSAECTLPNTPQDLRKWQTLGYTTAKYIGAWQKVFQTYSAVFPNQYVSLSAGAGQVGINDAGKIEKGGQARTRQTIVNDAIDTLGNRFVLQSSNVHAGPGPHEPNSETDDKFVIDYSGRIITGLQMRSSAENGSAVMGAKGDPALALQKSIDLAMEPNAAGQHIDYLEIYEPDVVAEVMQSVLRGAAARFASPRPIPRDTPIR
jgi:hypothetical protein